MFNISNNVAIINGSFGIYDGACMNPSVRYGRNAVSNHMKYLKDVKNNVSQSDKNDSVENIDYEKYVDSMKAQTLAPYRFEKQYMPKSAFGFVDTNALLGAAYEEVGQNCSLYFYDMDQILKSKNSNMNISSESLDFNNDNKIDIGEYATSILMADMLSTDPNAIDIKNINGVITDVGEKMYTDMIKSTKMPFAPNFYLYKMFNLDNETRKFVRNMNNGSSIY